MNEEVDVVAQGKILSLPKKQKTQVARLLPKVDTCRITFEEKQGYEDRHKELRTQKLELAKYQAQLEADYVAREVRIEKACTALLHQNANKRIAGQKKSIRC